MAQPHDDVISGLQDLGWSREHAAGIAANFQVESNFNPAAVGDGGKAYGIGQWHPDRQAVFQQLYGKPMQGSSVQDQLKFADYELRSGNEKAAGARLMKATSAQEAAGIVSTYYERPADKVGNAKNRGMIAAGYLGETPTVGVAQEGTQQPASASNGFPVLPTAGAQAKSDSAASGAADLARFGAVTAGDTQVSNGVDLQDQANIKTQAEKDAVGFGTAFSEALRSPKYLPSWAIMDKINQPSDIDAGQPHDWYLQNQADVEKGRTDDEVTYLRDNVKGPDTLKQANIRLMMDRDTDRTMGLAGGGTAMLAGMGAGLLDPGSALLGLGVGKVAAIAKIGHGAMIAAGRPAAAVGALAAENAAVNVAVEAASQAAGETKTSADYAMAALTGAALTLPFARGTVHEAANAASLRKTLELRDGAVREQLAEIEDMRKQFPEATPSEIAQRVTDAHVAKVADAVDEGTRPNVGESAFPEEVNRAIREDAEGTAEPTAPPVAEGTTPPPPEPVLEPKVLDPELPKVEPHLLDQPVVPFEERTKLPPALAKATPTYNFGQKAFGLGFANDIDRAIYIVSGKGESKAHAQYQKFLDDLGFSKGDIQAFGSDMRTRLKEHAAKAEPGSVLLKDSGAAKMAADLDEKLRDPGVDANADTKPELRQPLEPATPKPGFDGEGHRDIPGRSGQPVTLDWFVKPKSKMGGLYSLRDVMDTWQARLQSMGQGRSSSARMLQYFQKIASDDVKDTVQVRISEKGTAKVPNSASFDPTSNRIHIPKIEGEQGLHEKIGAFSTWHNYALLHEVAHAMTHSKIQSYLDHGLKGLDHDTGIAMSQFEDLFNRFRAEVKSKVDSGKWNPEDSTTKDALYATQNMHEFAAQVFSSQPTQLLLSRMEGKPVAGLPSSMWRELIGVLKRILGGKDNDGFTEATGLLDTIIRADGSNIRYMGGEKALSANSGAGAGVAQRNYAQQLYQHARNFVAKNPIDLRRTEVLLKNTGGVSDGLVLARSKNPIMQMVASLMLETTTGAAGRKANVAIRTRMLNQKLIGNSNLDYTNAYSIWRKANGGSEIEDIARGDKRREFDKLVYTETLNRRDGNYKPSGDTAVIKAADSLEQLFERSRQAQVQAGTLNSGNLPGNSRGYMPQALDGHKLQTLSVADLALLHDNLSAQFQARLGWDAQFADMFAPYYTERIRSRAQGDNGIDGLSAGGDGAQQVRDTLDTMGLDPALRNKAQASLTRAGGLGQTKTRLDIDLRQDIRPGLKLMDLYVTDTSLLARTYAKRTAGTVALTEQGIHGIRGIRELRKAAATLTRDGEAVTKNELDAFDRVAAEILGTRTGQEVVSAGATNIGLVVGLQRLGGLVFQQASETFQLINHLGLGSILRAVPGIAKAYGEVGRLKTGQASTGLLSHIDVYGGEIGMEHYKMVAPLDAPNGLLGDYLDQPGVISRLIRAGGHVQSKISGFRGLMAAQHRMVAEQIVMKAVRMIQDGGDSIALRDMGFTKDVELSLKGDLPRVAQYDASGKLVTFDLTKVSDPRTAEAFVQAVHRGVSQIIQGTFAGERSKWMSNDYAKLLLQLRTFGITAAEKSWGRQRMNHGYAAATGMLLGQMALALPIQLVRIELAAQGRADKDQFIKDQLNPATMTKTLMNYSSMSGFTGDVLDMLGGVAGGWGDQRDKELLGAKQQATSVGRIVPALGSADSAIKVASGKTDLYTAMKQLPGSNLWYLLPLFNLAKTNN